MGGGSAPRRGSRWAAVSEDRAAKCRKPAQAQTGGSARKASRNLALPLTSALRSSQQCARRPIVSGRCRSVRALRRLGAAGYALLSLAHQSEHALLAQARARPGACRRHSAGGRHASAAVALHERRARPRYKARMHRRRGRSAGPQWRATVAARELRLRGHSRRVRSELRTSTSASSPGSPGSQSPARAKSGGHPARTR